MNQEQAITAELKKSRIGELESQVRKHRELYYNDTPEIPDSDFDVLEDELRDLDPKNEVFSEVGVQVKTSHWSKATLPFTAGSLNKAMNVDELRAWVKKTGYIGAFVVSAKMDGASSIEKWNENGCQAIMTRGDGKVGELVTDNLMYSSGSGNGNYRAECVISKKNFDEFLAPKGYKNARNTASSLMRSPNADREDIEYLERIYYFKQGDFATEWDMWLRMEQEGMKTAWHTYCDTIEDVLNIYQKFLDGDRDKYEYEIDGLVVIIDARSWHKKLGSHGGRPKYGIAVKFPPKRVQTVIESVTWEIGDSGRFCPVAHVHPVSDGYAVIKNVTLHNMRFIRERKLMIGSKVSVGRSGDCIPYLYSNLDV